MKIQFSMIVLDVRDLRQSIEFYRLLGLEMPEPRRNRPVSLYRMDSGVSLILVEGFAALTDASWVRPERGYQQLLEFFAGEDAAVDAQWATLTSAGHYGRRAPAPIPGGVYAAMVDDPDGNVVMLSSDTAAAPGPALP